jgi:hypothetical protein
MSTRSRTFALGAMGLSLAALPAGAKAPSAKPAPPVVQTAVIENTGSTNTQGYRITISATGKAEYMATERRGSVVEGKAQSVTVGASLAQRLLRDLKAAMPLSTLPVRHGMKSASFGTSTYVEYQGQRSPDLSFPGNAKAQALHDDAGDIARALHLGNAPRR